MPLMPLICPSIRFRRFISFLYSSGERCFFLWQQEQSQQHFSFSFSVSFNFSALPFLFVYSYIIYPRGVFVNRLDKKLTIDNRRLTKVSCGEILGAIYAVLVDLVMVIWYNGGNRVEFSARQIGILRGCADEEKILYCCTDCIVIMVFS